MKKFILGLISLFLMIPIVKAEEVKEPVKVYIFEAGGCPWCEKEKEYLEGLEGYNEKFVIVSKLSFENHDTFPPAEDYELAVKVAEAFNARGFSDASSEGTPFVVISDLYAATVYNTDLEKVINEAYEKGDKDVVGCLEKGGTLESCFPEPEKEPANLLALGLSILALVVICGGVMGIVIYKDKKKVKGE